MTFMNFLVLNQPYLRETCKTRMSVNEKTSKCKGFGFVLVLEHEQKEVLKLNAITSENRNNVIENGTSSRRRDTETLQKHPKRPLAVTNKHAENQDVLKSSKYSP